jgi:quinol monooxygenase YgiN
MDERFAVTGISSIRYDGAHLMSRRFHIMVRFSLWAEIQAKPGKEAEVEAFLKSAQPLAEQEEGTLTWYVVRMGPGFFGIFDTFADEAGRDAHLNGEIAKALFSEETKALLAKDPQVHKIDVIAAKGPGA